jgi:hypothetical protein
MGRFPRCFFESKDAAGRLPGINWEVKDVFGRVPARYLKVKDATADCFAHVFEVKVAIFAHLCRNIDSVVATMSMAYLISAMAVAITRLRCAEVFLGGGDGACAVHGAGDGDGGIDGDAAIF